MHSPIIPIFGTSPKCVAGISDQPGNVLVALFSVDSATSVLKTSLRLQARSNHDSLLAEQLPRNHQLLNFASPLANRAQLHVAIKLLRRIILNESIPAMDLHAFIRHAHRHLAGKQFRHARFPRKPHILPIRQPSRLIHQQPRRLHFRRHVRQLKLNRLKLADRLPKLLPLLRVTHRRVQRSLRHPQRQSRNRNSSRHPESSNSP